MRRISIILIVMIVALSGLLAFSPIHASTPTPTPSTYYCTTLNLTASDGGFTNTVVGAYSPTTIGTWSSGWNVDDFQYPAAGTYGRTLVIQRDLSDLSLATVSSVTMTYSLTKGTIAPSTTNWFISLEPSGYAATDTTGTVINGTNTVSLNVSPTFEDTLFLQIYSGYDTTTAGYSGSGTITSVQICGNHTATPTPTASMTPTITPTPIPDTAWAFPLGPNERLSVGDAESPFTEISLSPYSSLPIQNVTVLLANPNSPNANVHAAIAGTVTAITSISGSCTNANPVFPAPPAYTCLSTDGRPSLEDAFFSYSGAYLVTESAPDDIVIYYILKTPTVKVGDSISKGCVIGNALSVNISGSSTLSAPSGGYTIIAASQLTTTLDVLPMLVAEPQDIRCSNANGKSTCKLVANSTFADDTSSWETEQNIITYVGPTIAAGGGLILVGQVKQLLSLNSSTNYVISLVVRLNSPGTATFDVQLGSNAAVTETVSSQTALGSQTLTIPATTYSPDNSGLFPFILRDMSSNTSRAVIDFACVADQADGLPTNPGGCILQNNEFDQQTGWTLGGGASYQTGTVKVVDGSTLTQSVALGPASSGPQSYTITISAETQTSSNTYSATWEWGSSTGSFSDWNTTVYTDKTDTLNVSAQATNDLIITFQDIGGGGIGLIVDSVCITTSDGSQPPGYGPAPPGYCKICAYNPIGDLTVDTPNLIQWLWCNLLQLWNCQAEPILYGIWQAVVDVLTFLGMLRLWLSFDIVSVGAWANLNIEIFARWLDGTINNAVTQLNGIGTSGGSGTNFFDVLVAFINGLRDIVTTLINDILALALALISLIGALIGLIISFLISLLTGVFGVIPIIVEAIIGGFNTAATATPTGAITCSDPTSLAYNICLSGYVLDNTIFSGAFQNIMPLLYGSVAFNMLLWGLNKIRGVFGGEE